MLRPGNVEHLNPALGLPLICLLLWAHSLAAQDERELTGRFRFNPQWGGPAEIVVQVIADSGSLQGEAQAQFPWWFRFKLPQTYWDAGLRLQVMVNHPAAYVDPLVERNPATGQDLVVTLKRRVDVIEDARQFAEDNYETRPEETLTQLRRARGLVERTETAKALQLYRLEARVYQARGAWDEQQRVLAEAYGRTDGLSEVGPRVRRGYVGERLDGYLKLAGYETLLSPMAEIGQVVVASPALRALWRGLIEDLAGLDSTAIPVWDTLTAARVRCQLTRVRQWLGRPLTPGEHCSDVT